MALTKLNKRFPVIGLTGPAGCGKDTLAAQLVFHEGYTRLAFADPMKMLLNERFGWTMKQWDDREWKERPSAFFGRGADGEWFSPRSWAQWIGTEFGRTLLGKDAWINVLSNRWAELGWPPLVIPDVRFNNEAIWVRDQGGVVFYIDRPKEERGEVRKHESEAGLREDLIDNTIVNNREPEHMLQQLFYLSVVSPSAR